MTNPEDREFFLKFQDFYNNYTESARTVKLGMMAGSVKTPQDQFENFFWVWSGSDHHRGFDEEIYNYLIALKRDYKIEKILK